MRVGKEVVGKLLRNEKLLLGGLGGGNNVTKEDICTSEVEAVDTPLKDEDSTPKGTTRRQFLKTAGVGGASLALFSAAGTSAVQSAAPAWVADAKTMVVQDASRCIGCRRCEIACSLSHDDKIQLSTARVKVSRYWSFGPNGPSQDGWTRGQGTFGDFRLVGDTCLQCAHPVPCLSACPKGAIEVSNKTGARVINQAKCVGCGTCTKACPWAMISLDLETTKAQKCDLCDGAPQCVKICPTGAIKQVPWRDRSTVVAPRQSVPAWVNSAAGAADSCAVCHDAL